TQPAPPEPAHEFPCARKLLSFFKGCRAPSALAVCGAGIGHDDLHIERFRTAPVAWRGVAGTHGVIPLIRHPELSSHPPYSFPGRNRSLVTLRPPQAGPSTLRPDRLFRPSLLPVLPLPPGSLASPSRGLGRTASVKGTFSWRGRGGTSSSQLMSRRSSHSSF